MIRRKNKLRFISKGDDDTRVNNDDDNCFKIKLSIKIGNKLIESDLDEALYVPTVDKLNPTMLSNMMSEIPALHARWNFLYNEAVYEYDILKTKLEVWNARKSREYRRQLSSDSKKVTERMVEDMIHLDPEYKKLNDDISIAKKSMKQILAQANGFGDKGDKIISIASMMKWEAENLAGASRKKYKHIQKGDEPIKYWPT